MKVIPIAEYTELLKAQGVPRFHLAFVCPVCQTVQSPADLIEAGEGVTIDDVEKLVGFSCIGRFTKAGPHQPGTPPGKGCDWTLGGLFHLHKIEVEAPTGARYPCFELATPEQAQAHMLKPRSFHERRCRQCGCIEEDCSQCIEKTGEACHWVEEDLCSACA